MRNKFKFLLTLSLSCVFLTALIQSVGVPGDLINSKQFFFIISFSIISLVSLIYILLSIDFKRLEINYTDIIVLIYFAYLTSNILYSNAPLSNNSLCILLSFLLYFLFRYILRVNNKLLISAFLLQGLIQSIYGLLQLYNLAHSLSHTFKVTGSFHNPGIYGIFLSSILPMALGIYLQKSTNTHIDKANRVLALLTAVTIILILPATQSRTAWVASLTGACIVFFYHYRVYLLTLINKTSKLSYIIGVASMLLLLTCYLLYQYKPSSAYGRLIIWQASKPMLAENPILGVGLGNFERMYGNYQARYFYEEQRDFIEINIADKVEYAFNDFLQITIEQGIIGLLLFVAIIVSLIKTKRFSLKEKTNSTYIALFASLVSVIISCLTSYPFEMVPIWINFIFLISLLSSDAAKPKVKVPQIISLATKTIIIALILLMPFVLFNTYKRLIASRKWLKAEYLLQNKEYSAAINIYDKVILELPYEGNLVLSYAKALSLSKEHKKSIKLLREATDLVSDPLMYCTMGDSYRALKEYKMAEEAYSHAINMIPNRMYPRYLLVNLYVEANEQGKAIQAAYTVLNMPVKIESEATQQMKKEVIKLINGIN